MGKASSADPMLDSFTYELEKLGAMAKKARVVAHIAGPSGAGKSTLLDDLRRENPDLVVKDLDDFDSEARARLGWGSVKKRDYTDRMFSELYTSRQSALDDFLEENKSQRVVLGGHHIEGSNVTKIPEGKKILMDTGALRSAWRNVRRSKKGEIQRLSGGSRKPQGKSWKDILFRHGGRPSLYRMGREDIRELRERGYVPMSSGEIHDLLKTAASSFDPMLDSFADELEKQAGFMEMLEDLKGKISATDLGALAATAIFAGVAVADVRRGGFRGRGAWPRAVEEAIALDRRLPKSRVRAIVKRVTPADVPKIEVVTTREQLRSRMEDRLGHVEIKGIGPLSFLPKRETAHLIDEATERLWREVEVTGNAMAAVGEKTSPFIVISPKAAETTVAHEVGHIVDYFRGGPNKASFDRMDAAMFGSAMDRAKAVSSEAVGRVFHPHYSKTILDPERAAWALVQESAERAKTMPAALKTYETGFHHTRAPMAMMAAGTVPAAWGVGRLIRRRGDDEEKTAGAREIVSQAQFDKLRHLVQEGRIDKGAFDGMRLLSPARALLPSRVVKVAAGPTVIGELLRRVGAGRSALKYDVGTGILGERMKKVLMAEYGPSWARILPRKASQGIADVAGKHPELAPMLALPGVPPGGPLVYVAPKLAIRRALGLRERKALELKLLSLAERGNISGLPSRKALTASLLGISAAGGVATGAVGSGIYSHYGNPDTPEAL
jgi:adenylate kinase family enzyme